MNFGLRLVSSKIFAWYSPSTDMPSICNPPKNKIKTMIVVTPCGLPGSTKYKTICMMIAINESSVSDQPR